MCLVRHWLPGEAITEETMGEALYLDQRHWEMMRDAVAAGIQQVL